MQPRAENGDGATGAVKCRVANELVIKRGVERLPDRKVVVGLDRFLPAVSLLPDTTGTAFSNEHRS